MYVTMLSTTVSLISNYCTRALIIVGFCDILSSYYFSVPSQVTSQS